MTRLRRTSIVSPALVLPLLILAGSPLAAQTTSRWSTTPASTDWFDPLNWNNGVPNSAGDIAAVAGSAVRDVEVDVTAEATVGQLDLLGVGELTIGGAGPLVFDNPGDAPASIQTLPPRSTGVDAEVATPISIAGGEALVVNVVQGNSVTLSGGIVSATGDVTKTGAGRLTLAGDSSGWEGSLSVNEGDLLISNVHALSRSTELLVGPDIDVTFVSQDETEQFGERYFIPNLSLNGGTIQTNDGFRQRHTDLEANIHILGDSTIRVTTEDTLYLYGEIDGPGGISFLQLFDQTVNVGLSDSTFLYVRGPTSYSGETYVGPNMRVAFQDAAALGNTNEGTRIFQGVLELLQGGGAEQIEVEQGRLHLVEASQPYGHRILLKQGQLAGGEDDGIPSVVSALVQYVDGALLGTESGGDQLVLAGGIQGNRSIAVQNKVDISAESTIRGHLYGVSFRAGTTLSAEMNISGDIFVAEGSLRLSADIQSPETVVHLSKRGLGLPSSLSVGAGNTLKSILLDPREADSTGFFQDFSVSVDDGALLTVTDEIRFLGGTIRGAVAGQPVLVKRDQTPGFLEDIAGSEFERVDVKGGVLTVIGDAGEAPPEIHLGSQDNTNRIIIASDGVYRGDIYLHNAQGSINEGALILARETTIAGNIFLGEVGASFSPIVATGEVASITGVIHGGDLTFVGRGDTAIRSGQHTYSGATKVWGETLSLVDQGVLNSTIAIVGAGRILSGGGRAALILDNSGAAALDDRIPNDTPVHLNGMKLTLVGREGEHVTERLGVVYASQGTSEIAVQDPATSGSQTSLVITNLNRMPGGAMLFDVEKSTASVQIKDSLVLDDNLIGGWAIVRGYQFSRDLDFATYGPDGVTAYRNLHTYVHDLAAASATDNVDLYDQNVVLASDTSVNALRTRVSEIDLNNHRLTLESGGLLLLDFTDSIKGGQLTAGTEAGAELLVSGLGRIDADIVDNAHGAVGLTYTGGSGEFVLAGVNTYSGPTVVNSSQIILASETALPVGGDVVLNGGFIQIDFESSDPLVLGDIEMRDGALLRAEAGELPTWQPESLHVESGDIANVAFVGDAHITKTGRGNAFFDRSLATHTGPIEIEQGQLEIDALGPAPIDDDHAITIYQGGRLRTSRDFVIADRKLRLDGGVIDIEFRGGVSAPIEVLDGGGYIRNERGITPITSNITGSGDLIVEGGFGNGHINFDADLSAFEGELHFTGGSVSLIGDHSSFAQPIHIAAANLGVSGANALGIGKATVLPDGRLTVTEVLRADLELAGGILDMQASATSTPA